MESAYNSLDYRAALAAYFAAYLREEDYSGRTFKQYMYEQVRNWQHT